MFDTNFGKYVVNKFEKISYCSLFWKAWARMIFSCWAE